MHKIKIAILDLYEGEVNEGMRCIKQLVSDFQNSSTHFVESEIFDVRRDITVPDLSFDIFISSGGPGSPLDSAGSEWERKYFELMDAIQEYNQAHTLKKFVLLICHSFQIFCRHYNIAKISKRKSTAFGVMPIYKTRAGNYEPLFDALEDPFWSVDSRDYQITQPSDAAIKKLGGHILCIEKHRPLVPLERAVMAIRFNNEIIGMQFHPEADSDGMFRYLVREDKKKYVVEKYGEKKYKTMLQNLNDPEKIKSTYHTIIPTFLQLIQGHYDRVLQTSLQQQL